jgi:hypothetical protein
MMSEALNISYKATPTARKFHRSRARVRVLMGCIGSGKSVACCWEIFRRCCEQRKNQQGLRKSRWAIVRNTYGELRETTLKTWLDWFPTPEFGTLKDGAPITYHLNINDVRAEILFLALDRPKDVKKLLSLELTGVWFNEAREADKALVDGADGRVGRYPAQRDGGPTWWGMILDTNPPDDDHWLYHMAEEERPRGWGFFKQPPAMIPTGDDQYRPNPEAENVENLPPKYYESMIPGKTREWIKVYVLGEYGTIEEGRPVFPEFRDIHAADGELLPYRNLPLVIGFDFGLNPSAVLVQMSPYGQIRVLDELVADGMGLRQHIDNVLKTHLAQHYPGMDVRVVGDPAGVARSQTDERTCFEILEEAGFKAEPAATNDFTARRDAVATPMLRMADGKPGFVVSTRCKLIRKGFRGAYQYRRLQVAGESRFVDKPDKNLVSHPMDALQYACLYFARPAQSQKRTHTTARTYRPATAAGY